MSHEAKRRPGSGEIWFAVTNHDGVQVDSILIDQAKFSEAARQVRASNFDLPVALGLQLADHALKIILIVIGSVIAVADAHGELISLVRLDGAPLASIVIAAIVFTLIRDLPLTVFMLAATWLTYGATIAATR